MNLFDNLQKLYETDEYAWKLQVVKLHENDKALCDYLLSEAKRDVRDIKSHGIILFKHLLKWQFQPERQSESWYKSIINSSGNLEQIFNDSKTLLNEFKNKTNEIYDRAKKEASHETKLSLNTFPNNIPWDIEKVFDYDFVMKFMKKHEQRNKYTNYLFSETQS